MRGAAGALPTLGAVVALCLPVPAWSDSDEADELRKAHRPRRSAEILLDMDDVTRAEREAGGTLRIRKRYGFEYAHRFDSRTGAPPLVFSIQGPALPHKRFGLSFELRF